MIYAYNLHSESAKLLAEKLSFKRISHKNSSYKGNPNKVVINWGASVMPEEVLKSTIINHPDIVEKVINKLSFFELMGEDVNIPEYTTDTQQAFDWASEGNDVVLRSVVNGHSGLGIHMFYAMNAEDYPHFSSYWHGNRIKFATKYIPKKEEYRVHVVNGEVIDVRRKVARDSDSIKNWKVRSHGNGFIFQKGNISPHPQVLEQALKAIEKSGLTFGAVDVIWNEFRGKAYVLEINTAPGLEGSTVDEYVKAFQELFTNENAKHSMKLKDYIKELSMESYSPNAFVLDTVTMEDIYDSSS